MAQEINSIINSLTSMKPKIEKLAKNNELINIIDDLNDLIADAESFGGVIKQLVPVQLKAQVDALTGVYNQLKTISKSASTAVDNIIDNVDNIPIGQLRKKSMKSIADEGQEDEGYGDDIDTTPNTAMGAQSAIGARRESNTLSDYYKSNFKENKSMKSAGKFSWANIKSDFEETDNDLGALGKAIRENKNFAPADQLGDIFKHLSETAENAAMDAINDDAFEYTDGATAFTENMEDEAPRATGAGFDWKKMAESAGADMLRGIMEAQSIDSGANIDISSAQDVAGDAIRAARR